jgi:hypothetical protein
MSAKWMTTKESDGRAFGCLLFIDIKPLFIFYLLAGNLKQ